MKKIGTFIIVILMMSCQGQMSFNDQIVNDLNTKIPTGICDSIPKGSILTNIVVGEIVDIGLNGMTDVTYELDYEVKGKIRHHKSALLYLKSGSKYRLASMGGCEFEMK